MSVRREYARRVTVLQQQRRAEQQQTQDLRGLIQHHQQRADHYCSLYQSMRESLETLQKHYGATSPEPLRVTALSKSESVGRSGGVQQQSPVRAVSTPVTTESLQHSAKALQDLLFDSHYEKALFMASTSGPTPRNASRTMEQTPVQRYGVVSDAVATHTVALDRRQPFSVGTEKQHPINVGMTSKTAVDSSDTIRKVLFNESYPFDKPYMSMT